MARKRKRAPLTDRERRVRAEAARIRSLYKVGAPVIKNQYTYSALDYLDRQHKKGGKIRPHLVSAKKRVQRKVYGTTRKYFTGAVLFPIDATDMPIAGENTITPSVRRSISLARSYVMQCLRNDLRTSVMFRYIAAYEFGRAKADSLIPSSDYMAVKTRGWMILADREEAQAYFEDEILELGYAGYIIVDITVQGQKVKDEV